MIETASGIENLTITINREIQVQASVEDTFEALLDQLGPASDTPEGQPLPMKIEPWPGGRWYRDLGGDNGHLWGHVQAVKRPALMEITGPLFVSAPVVSNIQYRLSEHGGGTLLKFHHIAFGLVSEEMKQGFTKGWTHIESGIRAKAEARRKR